MGIPTNELTGLNVWSTGAAPTNSPHNMTYHLATKRATGWYIQYSQAMKKFQDMYIGCHIQIYKLNDAQKHIIFERYSRFYYVPPAPEKLWTIKFGGSNQIYTAPPNSTAAQRYNGAFAVGDKVQGIYNWHAQAGGRLHEMYIRDGLGIVEEVTSDHITLRCNHRWDFKNNPNFAEKIWHPVYDPWLTTTDALEATFSNSADITISYQIRELFVEGKGYLVYNKTSFANQPQSYPSGTRWTDTGKNYVGERIMFDLPGNHVGESWFHNNTREKPLKWIWTPNKGGSKSQVDETIANLKLTAPLIFDASNQNLGSFKLFWNSNVPDINDYENVWSSLYDNALVPWMVSDKTKIRSSVDLSGTYGIYELRYSYEDIYSKQHKKSF